MKTFNYFRSFGMTQNDAMLCTIVSARSASKVKNFPEDLKRFEALKAKYQFNEAEVKKNFK
jgi:hypothetical protein